MPTVVVDDLLLRDVLVGERSSDLGGLATRVVTTGLWLFRLASAWAAPDVAGKLSAPVRALSAQKQEQFVAALVSLPVEIEVLSLRDLAWPMARLQQRHRAGGRPLSVAMAEALAAAQELDASLAVSRRDVGPNLRSAAAHDGVPFHVL